MYSAWGIQYIGEYSSALYVSGAVRNALFTMLRRAVLSIFRKPTGWENESMISAIPVESLFSAFIFHFTFMLEISLSNCLWQFFTLPEKNIYHFSVLHQKPAKITRKAWLLWQWCWSVPCEHSKKCQKMMMLQVTFFTWNMWKQEVFEYPWEGKTNQRNM